MYRRAAGREGGNVEGPRGVFLQASCIRLEGFSARRDVCPQQPPITSIVFPWKASFYFSCSKERAPPRFLYRPGYNYVFTSRALDKQILSWSKTLAEKKNFFADWWQPVAFLSSRISFVRHRASDTSKFGASHLAAGLILTPIRTARSVRQMKV